MRRSSFGSGLALASVLVLAGTDAQARFDGGGGGGFRGGGGFSGASVGGGDPFRGDGGGAYRFSAPPVQAAPIERSAPAAPRISSGGQDASGGWADQPVNRSLDKGYQGSHPLYGAGARTPWTGHNMSPDQFRRLTTGGSTGASGFDNERFNRNVKVENNFYNRNYGGWNDTWGNGGYWGSRAWGYGWYSWSPDTWGWWGGSSVGWGLAALAGADVITSLVNTAAAQESPVIDVPDSDYQLNYGTVDSVGSGGADFSYAVAGSPPVKGAANCQQGLLDGQVPSTAAQAQLLNAACQVAYAPDPKGTPLADSLGERLPGWLRDLLLVALGAGIGVAAWQWSSRHGHTRASSEHHARVTGS